MTARKKTIFLVCDLSQIWLSVSMRNTRVRAKFWGHAKKGPLAKRVPPTFRSRLTALQAPLQSYFVILNTVFFYAIETMKTLLLCIS